MGNDGTLNFDTKIDSSGFQKGLNKVGGIAKAGIGLTTRFLQGATAGFTALGAAATKVGSDFGAGMSQVQAISGASGEDLEKLKNKAKEMGATTKFSATESAEALNYMAMAGWKTSDMLSGIEGIMNLAAASGEDLATTSDIVTDAMTAFGMAASDSTHFADILAAASSNANTNVAMMGETFKYVAPVAGALGYSAEDTALAVGLMANSGIKASQAGTSLRSALTRLAKPTDEVQSKMVELGLAVQQTEHVIDASKVDKLQGKIADKTATMQKAQINYNNAVAKYGADSAQAKKAAISLETAQRKLAETSGDLSAAQAGTNKVVGITNTLMTDGKGNMNSFHDVIVQLRESFKGLSQEQQMQAAATLFGQEAMSGMLAIINASDKDFEKLAGSIETCSDGIGSAAEMAEIMQDNLQGQITILQSGLEGLGISLYETFQGTAKDVVKEAQSMVQQLQDAFNTDGLDGFVSAVGDVLAQIIEQLAGEAPELVNMAVSLVGSLCEGLKSAPGIGDSAASLITSLVTGLFSCVDDIWTTAIVLVGKMAEGVAAGAPQMVQAISTTVTDILECLVDWGPDLIQAGIDILLALVEGIASTIPTLITQAVTLLTDFCNTLVQNIPAIVDAGLQLVQGLIQGLVDGVPLLLESAITLFMSILEALPVVIDQLLGALPDLITTICDFFAENIPLIVDAAIQLLMGIIEAIPTIIQAIVDNLPLIITSLVDGLTGALPQIVQAAIALLMDIIEAIPDIVVAIAENLPQIITAIASGLAQAIPQIFTAAKDLLWQLILAVPDIVVGIGQAIPDIISGIVNGLIGGIGAVWDAACELGSGILDGIKSFFGINSPFTVMAEQGDYLVQGLINGLAEMPDQMMQTLDTALNNLITWGQQMLSGIQNTVQSMVNSAEQVISQLPGKIWTHLVDVVTKVISWGQQMLSAATTAIQNMVSSIISKLAELPRKVASKLAEVTAVMVQWGADIVSKMTEVGRNIVSGIWNGISSGWDWLRGKVADLAASLLDSAKSALGVNSPSTEFRDQLGRWLMPGTVEGVKKSMPKTLRDMKEQAGKLIAAMQGTVDAAMNNFSLTASGGAGLRAATAGATFVEIDNRQSQENNYYVPVPSPSEVAKNQREAFRNFQKDVK